MLITEEILEKFLEMKEEQKQLEKKINEIKDILIELGSFATTNYICAIKEQERVSIKPLADVIDVFGRDMIEEYELIQRIRFKTVSIAKKI